MELTSAIVAAAGAGTRLAPLSRYVPKEMFALPDGRPVVAHVIEELIRAGVEHLWVVSNNRKTSLNDYCLDVVVPASGRLGCDINLVMQESATGDGDAILLAMDDGAATDSLIVWADEIFRPGNRAQAVLAEYSRNSIPVVAVKRVADSAVEKCGMVDIRWTEPTRIKIDKFVEKPSLEGWSTRLAAVGGYILHDEIISLLRSVSGKVNDNRLSCALTSYVDAGGDLSGVQIASTWYESGSLSGYCKMFAAIASEKRECGTGGNA